MNTPGWHIAQSNIARMRFDLEDPRMAGFVERLDELNRIADQSDGFVWRYVTPEGDTTEQDVFGDPLILFNLSVWESIEALESYVYRSDHVKAVQRRADWFERPTRSPLVLWWIPASHRPDVAEARRHFDYLWQDGPGPQAFTFRHRFAAPATVA